jgi:NADH:ubiquinone oxidoreductase subunit 3 (subunit A)
MVLFHVEYFSVFIFLLISIILSFVIFFLSYFVAAQVGGTEKLSAYECGFEPFEDARNTFDVRFYIIAILFIIFDLEVTFLFPWAIVLSTIGSFGFWIMIDFLIELTVGFVYVWKKGALDL